MLKSKNTRCPQQRLALHARTVELASRLERATLEKQQLIARYSGQGLAVHEIPGIRRALGVIRTLKRAMALVEVELANA